MKTMNAIISSLLLAFALLAAPAHAAKLPDYFLLSFLDLDEDMAEAQSQGKHLLLYFHQEGCPYCLAMENTAFPDPRVDALLRKHFLGIDLNIWGDRLVTLADGEEISEKALARKLNVQFTPTILLLQSADLLNPSNLLTRINGYRKPDSFIKTVQTALNQGQATQAPDISLAVSDYPFAEYAVLAKPATDKPLALFFEQGDCADCRHMHKLLQKQQISKLLDQYRAVRLHAADTTPITFAGKSTNPARLAEQFNISYHPSVLLFDFDENGHLTERLRMDSFLKAFHFATALDFVAAKVYARDNNFQNHINARATALREQGIELDIWE